MKLSKVAQLAKKAFVGGVLIVLLYYLATLAFIPIFGRTVKRLFPEKNPPTPIYGKLAALVFEEKKVGTQQPVFKLDTKTGRLPTDIPDRMVVYEYLAPAFSYQAGKNAQEEALILGYTDADLVTDLKGDIYRWRSVTSGGTLEIKINTRELTLITPLDNAGNNFTRVGLSADNAIKIAQNMFEKTNRLYDPAYQTGAKTAILGKFNGSKIVETGNPNEATIARVDFFKKINKYPVLGPDPTIGSLHAYVRNLNSINPTYNYPIFKNSPWEIKTVSNATYPIISVEKAWNEVKANKGVIVSVIPSNGNRFENYKETLTDTIFIDNIYLAYYETPAYQKYLQPIYVFEGKYTARGGGNGKITVYLPAIAGEYVYL